MSESDDETETEVEVETTPRKQALERAAEMRALIQAHINNMDDAYVTVGQLRKDISELEDYEGNLNQLLTNMASNELIGSMEIENAAPYKVGYYSLKHVARLHSAADTTLGSELPTPQKRGYTRKQSTLAIDRPEVRVENDRIVIEHPRCRVIVELK